MTVNIVNLDTIAYLMTLYQNLALQELIVLKVQVLLYYAKLDITQHQQWLHLNLSAHFVHQATSVTVQVSATTKTSPAPQATTVHQERSCQSKLQKSTIPPVQTQEAYQT